MINRKTRNENGKKESFFQWMIFCGLLLIFVHFLCVPYFAETENNIDKNKTIYVYFGEYPQTELDDTEINDEVINTYYDENDEGSIDGVKYLRKKSQDEQYHYYKYEPVRWRVMKKEDRNLYLISDKVIESGEYFAKETWENSELRKKLNNDFVNKLLSEQELSACISVNEDYVWILDESEWYNSEYGFSGFCKISENNTRHFYVSDYVKSNEYIWNIKNQTSILLKEENESFGYLRPDGMTYTFDNSQDTGAYGVCPVICVDESAVEYMDVSEEIKDPNINNGNVKKVYIGYYPQSEILGDALNEAIINSKYDMNGDTVVNGIKYKRVSSADYYDKRNKTDFFYFKWNQGGDDNGYHYFQYEPIRWRILEENDEEMLLISCDVIDTKPYDTLNRENYSYEDSTLRKWVISDKFMNMVFTNEQQQILIEGNIKDGLEFSDKLWIPAVEDMTCSSYGFNEDYWFEDINRMAMPTDFAHAMGAEVNLCGTGWWLRDILWDLNANIVNYYGYVHPEQGAAVSSSEIGLRLMARVKKNSNYIFDSYEMAQQYYENENLNHYQYSEIESDRNHSDNAGRNILKGGKNRFGNMNIIIIYLVIIALFLFIMLLFYKMLKRYYIKLVIRNIKVFATKKTYYFIMILLGQVISFVVLLMSYGILQNNFATKDEVTVSDTMYTIEFQNEEQNIKEFQTKIQELTECMRDDFEICNIFLEYNNEKLVTFLANSNYYEVEYEGMFEYNQVVGNDCVARVAKILEEYHIGDEIEIAGKNYRIIGKYNSDMPQVPINTLNNECVVKSVQINLHGIPMVNDSERYTKKLKELFGDNVLTNKPQGIDLLSIQKKNFMIIGTIAVTILIIMNSVLCYIYVLKSRKKWMAVMEICGAGRKQCIIMYLLEILTINVLSSFVGICIFVWAIYGKMVSINMIYKEIYSMRVYGYISVLYLVVATILTLYYIVKFVNTSTLNSYKNV